MDLTEETELFEQLLKASQEVAVDAHLSADCIRSDTDAASGSGINNPAPDLSSEESPSSPSPCAHRNTTSWWAPVLKGHVKEHAKDPINVKPITLVSACAGSCAEAEVLKVPCLVLGIQVCIIMVAKCILYITKSA